MLKPLHYISEGVFCVHLKTTNICYTNRAYTMKGTKTIKLPLTFGDITIKQIAK